MKSERPWGKVYITSLAFNPHFMLLQDLLPFSFLAKRTQFTFLFCLHTSALMIFWSCMHHSRTREVGSEERWLWKSFYCLSSSPSWLPSVQLLSCPNFSQADSRPPDCCCSTTTARWARRWSSSRPRRIRVKMSYFLIEQSWRCIGC